MKKRIILCSLLILPALLLGACGAASGAAPTDSSSSFSPPDGEALPEGMEALPEGIPAGEMRTGELPDGALPQRGQSGADADEQVQAIKIPVRIDLGDDDQANSEAFLAAEEPAEVDMDGVLVVGNKTFIKSHEDINAGKDDLSAAIVTNGGDLTVAYADVVTSGSASSLNNSILYGQNAAIVASEDTSLKVLYDILSTSGDGAHGVFALGEQTTVKVMDVELNTAGDYASGVLSTEMATMSLTDVNITTTGANAAAIAVANGPGTINAAGGIVKTSGENAPALATTGDVAVSDAVLTASGSEAALVNTSYAGSNSITLSNTEMSSSKDDKATVKIYRSMTSEEDETEGAFTMTGGILSNSGSSGPLFYVTNTTANITLSEVDLSASSDVLLYAGVSRSGELESDGGNALLTANNQNLEGILAADKASTVSLVLMNGSTFTGAVNTDDAADAARVSLDASSTWEVTADSYLTKINLEEGITGSEIDNIIGNGFTVYYNTNANTYLKGAIYSLSGGGFLKPLN